MPHIDVSVQYLLRVSGQELNLIGKALAGMDMTDEQRAEGRLLNLRLMEQKAKNLHEQHQRAMGALAMAAGEVEP